MDGMMNSTLIVFVFLVIGCSMDEVKVEKPSDKHEFEYFSFSCDSNWKEHRKDDSYVTYYKPLKLSKKYVPNFSILYIDDTNTYTKTLDEIVEINMNEVLAIYEEVKIINYDTVRIGGCDVRKVSYAALTFKGEKIGSLVYVYRKGNKLLMASFQGDNENGRFRDMVDELNSIAETIEFK
jgi:hypothetical protein